MLDDGIALRSNDLLIPLTDGAELAAHVYRPGTDRPVPAVVSLYPYRKDDVIGAMRDFQRLTFASAGYADVLVDLRGIGSSSGRAWDTWDSIDEGLDGAAAIEWVARQPWCSGDVGIWGISYGAITAFNVAQHRPRGLRAAVALYGSPDIRADFLFPGGVPNGLGNAVRETFMLAMDMAAPSLRDPDGRWQRTWRERLDRLTDGDVWSLDWQARADDEEHWARRRVDCGALDLPFLIIGGWNDIFPDAAARAFAGLRGPKRAVIGPWVHVPPDVADREAWDWLGEAVAWWDVWLRERPEVEQVPAIRYFVMGAEPGWRARQDLPLAGDEQLVLHLNADGRLSEEAPLESGVDACDPDPTVGTCGMLLDPMGVGLGYPEDQGLDLSASLAFLGDPLADRLEIAGIPVAHLWLAPTGWVGQDIVVKLFEVRPGHRARHVATGWLAATARSGGDGPPEQIVVPLWATAYRFAPGSRVALGISTADFPHGFPRPGGEAVRVHHGPGRESRIVLPVVDEERLDLAPAIPRPDPDVDRRPRVISSRPSWSVLRDMATGDTTVTYGNRVRMRGPRGISVGLDIEGVAVVSRSDPASAVVEASSRLDLEEPGWQCVASGRGRMTRTTLSLEGRVELDEATVFHAKWSNEPGVPRTVVHVDAVGNTGRTA